MFKKYAAAESKVVTPFEYIREIYGNTRVAGEKEVAYQELLPDHLSNYVLAHSTIIASVDVEKTKDHYITPQTSVFVNKNGDAWERGVILSTYGTFVGTPNYVNHVQIPSLSVGTNLDAVAIQHDDSVYVHLLTATHKKHSIAKRIIDGSIHAMSMGADVQFTICSACGKKISDVADMCEHVRYQRGLQFQDEQNVVRVIAELCGHRSVKNSNKFIEASWVEDPAFIMAQTHSVVAMPSTAVSIDAEEAYNPSVSPTIEFKMNATPNYQQMERYHYGDNVQKVASVVEASEIEVPIGPINVKLSGEWAHKHYGNDPVIELRDWPEQNRPEFANFDMLDYGRKDGDYAWLDGYNVIEEITKKDPDYVVTKGEIAKVYQPEIARLYVDNVMETAVNWAMEQVQVDNVGKFVHAVARKMGPLTTAQKIAAIEMAVEIEARRAAEEENNNG